MANYEKRGRRTRARVFVNGQRESATFPTKAEAVTWATQRELELTGAKLPDHSVKDALRRYGRDVAPLHKGARWELVRLAMLERDPLAAVRLPRLSAAHIADWRDRRLAEVSSSSVAREMNLLRSVLEKARKEWLWLRINPTSDVARPRSPASRKRRISQDEADRLALACGLGDGLKAETATNRTGLAFLFALETAMRAGEILGLQWADVGQKSVRLPDTKNGDARSVPLSPRAREILAALPKGEGQVFDLEPATRDVLFRKARDKAEIPNLRFHDSRAEAIWRLSKTFDVLELARVIGHRDLRSLLIYFQTSADELADRLG